MLTVPVHFCLRLHFKKQMTYARCWYFVKKKFRFLILKDTNSRKFNHASMMQALKCFWSTARAYFVFN